jgi:hypothetical protein
MRNKCFLLSIAIIWSAACSAAIANVPELMHFQGRLTDANNIPLNGAFSIQFSIYDSATNGTQKWSETQPVTLDNGFFSVLLGSVTPIDSGIFSRSGVSRYLGIKIDPDPEMVPRLRITTAGYAYVAENLGPGVVNIDPNDNVGIGTSTPGIITGSSRYLTISGGKTASLELRGFENTDGGTVAKIDFIESYMSIPVANKNIARIEARNDFDGGGKLIFRTYNNSELKSPVTIDAGGHTILVADQSPTVLLKPTPTLLVLGDSTEDCLRVKTAEGEGGLIVKSDGKVGIGTTSPATDLEVNGIIRTDELQISGGADIAEPFEIDKSEPVIPGMVVIIDTENPGKLKVSDKPYDRTAAGVISGAGGIRPGLTMAQKDRFSGEYTVALTGRVYALCDAKYGPIQPGDLLTTSATPGHSMKVSDYEKAQGAIIGKAMTGLREGTGLVLILVSLQ